MARELVVFVRTSVDWSSMTNRKFREQPMAGKSPKLRWLIRQNAPKVWNRVFNLTYFQFRAGLQAIGERSLKATGLRILRGPTELQVQLEEDPDIMLLPTDDDDLLCPHISDALAPHLEHDVLYWDDYFVRNGVCREREEKRYFTTNGAALTGHIVADDPTIVVDPGFVKKRTTDRDVCKVPGRLSATNRTEASITRMIPVLRQRRPGHKLRRAAQSAVRVVLPGEPSWLASYLSDVQELRRQLLA